MELVWGLWLGVSGMCGTEFRAFRGEILSVQDVIHFRLKA